MKKIDLEPVYNYDTLPFDINWSVCAVNEGETGHKRIDGTLYSVLVFVFCAIITELSDFVSFDIVQTYNMITERPCAFINENSCDKQFFHKKSPPVALRPEGAVLVNNAWVLFNKRNIFFVYG